SGSFWSGFVYYPLSIAGDIQYYGFFIENDTDNGWENNVSIRFFAVPSKDTTINWVSFDNQPIIVSVNEKNDLVSDFELFQNYPNPFNPSTQINYDLPGSTKVKLIVYNSLGQQIETLVSKVQAAGLHSLNFNASPSLPSGVYYIQLTTNYGAKSIKVLLLK
ncbi:MAG: T9SS type A sorting domain-containing protein, partial [Ignavibacteriaceae bacterium]